MAPVHVEVSQDTQVIGGRQINSEALIAPDGVWAELPVPGDNGLFRGRVVEEVDTRRKPVTLLEMEHLDNNGRVILSSRKIHVGSENPLGLEETYRFSLDSKTTVRMKAEWVESI